MTLGNNTMRQAMRLMQSGELQAATRTLQDALGGNASAAPVPPAQGVRGAASSAKDCSA